MQEVSLVVDHCSVGAVNENINSSAEDRQACSDTKTSTGERFLLNLNTPLELGGRSKPAVNYPSNLQPGINGCIKNLMYNGMVGVA